MAALSTTSAATTAKMLFVGNSGMGKTGALASLAKAGYNLRIADNDSGTEILFHLLKSDPAALARVDVETHVDKYTSQNGVLRAAAPLTGFSGTAKVMTDWPGLGKPSTWGPSDILVWDSLTLGGKFILNHVLNLSGRLAQGQPPQIQDWGMAMELQENVLAGLYGLPCHVIVTSHLVNITPEGEAVAQMFPSALGNKLPQKVGRYFNSTLGVKMVGAGPNKVRTIHTKDPSMGCKTPAPGLVKDTYPLETGLADYFQDLFGPVKGA